MCHITKWNAFERTLLESDAFDDGRDDSCDVNNNTAALLAKGGAFVRRSKTAANKLSSGSMPLFVVK